MRKYYEKGLKDLSYNVEVKMQFKDSGERRDFGTGAVRDKKEGKGRFDLLPYDALHQLACVFETGADKYAPRNWEAGLPVSEYIDSAGRHLAKAASGSEDEPHLPMCLWNVACAIQTYIWASSGKLPLNLRDVDMSLFPYSCDTRPASVAKPPDPKTETPTTEEQSFCGEAEFVINDHIVRYKNSTSGWIDGEYMYGTDFETALRRIRGGHSNLDEEVEAAYEEAASQ